MSDNINFGTLKLNFEGTAAVLEEYPSFPLSLPEVNYILGYTNGKGIMGPKTFGVPGLTRPYLAGIARLLDEEWLNDRPELDVERRAYKISGIPLDDDFCGILKGEIERLWQDKIEDENTSLPFYVYLRSVSGMIRTESGSNERFRSHTVQLRLASDQERHHIMIVGNTKNLVGSDTRPEVAATERSDVIAHFIESFNDLHDESQTEVQRAAMRVFEVNARSKLQPSWVLNMENEEQRLEFDEILASAHRLADNLY